MKTVRIDEISPNLLGAIAEPVEIVDPEGRTLGQFFPDAERVRRLYGNTDHLPSQAEIERLHAEPGPRYSTRQVFEHLLTLTTDPGERAHLEGLIQKRSER
jgi:hypothetical protein